MKTALSKTNLLFLLFSLWVLALIIAGGSAFAQDSAETAYVRDTTKAFETSFTNAEDAVNQALTEKGVGDKVSSRINGRGSKPIFAYNKPVTVEARGITFDTKTGRWDASLVFIADGEAVSAIPASGHFDEMMEIAVLKHEMHGGDIIRDSDVEIRDFSINHIRTDTITDLASIIGKTPLRAISPYRPIRSAEIVQPAIMKKDAFVQMRYSMPGMEITTSGQAMSAGAKGDVIGVRNSTSKRIVRAVIEDSQTVNIIASGAEHAEN